MNCMWLSQGFFLKSNTFYGTTKCTETSVLMLHMLPCTDNIGKRTKRKKNHTKRNCVNKNLEYIRNIYCVLYRLAEYVHPLSTSYITSFSSFFYRSQRSNPNLGQTGFKIHILEWCSIIVFLHFLKFMWMMNSWTVIVVELTKRCFPFMLSSS